MGNVAVDTIRAARAATEKLGEAERSLRDQHSALLRERDDVASAYPSQDEVLSNMTRIVDRAVAEWTAKQSSNVVGSFSGSREVRGNGDTSERVIAPRLPRFLGMGDAIEVEDLVGLFPDLIKARYFAIIKSAPVRFGLPSAARVKKLSELDHAIEEAESNHTALVDEAASVGVSLRLLETVRIWRETEARAAELKAMKDREAVTVPFRRR